MKGSTQFNREGRGKASKMCQHIRGTCDIQLGYAYLGIPTMLPLA